MPPPFAINPTHAPVRPRLRSAQGQRGFVLIITILLIAFLTLLMVSMASLTRVETQIAANYQHLDDARQNALTALNIALGQLQAAAGPDQRVTARAEILDSVPATAKIDTVNQPYWTGVWKTGNAPLDVVVSGVNSTEQRYTSLGSTDPTSPGVLSIKAAKAIWLVSLPTDSTAATSSPITTTLTVADDLTEASLHASAALSGISTSTTPTAVILAKQVGRKDPSALPNVTLPDGTVNRGFIVAAPLVKLQAVVPAVGSGLITIGKYAYWIGDEGVKAKVNLIDPTLAASATTTTGQAHFLAPQANAIHKITGLVVDSSVNFQTANTPANLAKVIAQNSFLFLPTTPAGLNLKPYLTDITPYSHGVLADVKNGGLKKDLTAAFESTAGYNKLTGVSPDYGYGQKMLYRNFPGLTIPFGASPDAVPYAGMTDGLPWAALHTYYNTYKSMMSLPSGLTTTTGPLTPSTPTTTGSLTSLPYELTPRVLDIKSAVGDTRYGGMMPEIISYRMDIALGSYLPDPTLDCSASNRYKLRLLYYPQLVIYNPYNCRLKITNFFIQKEFSAFYSGSLKTDGFRITVSVGGVTVAKDIVLNQVVNSRIKLQSSATGGVCDSLEPGETRVFGLASESSTQATSPTAAINCLTLTSTGSMSPNFSQWIDLPVSSTYHTSELSDSAYDNGPAYAGTANKDDLVTVRIRNSTGLITIFATESGQTYTWYKCLWPYTADLNRFTLTSTGYSSYAPRDSDWTSLPISSLSNPRKLTGFFYRKKGLVASSPTTTYLNGGVIVPLFHGNAQGFSIYDNNQSGSWGEYTYGKFGENFSSASEISLLPAASTGTWETYLGGQSVGRGSGPAARLVLRDVPGQPLVSLGQFMHMPFTSVALKNSSPLCLNYFKYGMRDNGSMFIGGSLCNPFITTTQTFSEWTYPNPTFVFDDSFLANDTLFDRFYFSTVPPAAPSAPVTAQWSTFITNNTGTSLSEPTPVFPNARLRPYYRNGLAPKLIDLQDFDMAAANLLLYGAFNVNSTSIDAWKALLSSLSGNDLQVFKSISGTSGTISASTLKNPIPRFWASSATGAVNQAWEGARALSDDEVTELATRIVEQVKKRGPFLSMSDFLNRRLGTACALTRVGCLQAAIDNSSLNDTVKLSGAAVNASGSTQVSKVSPPVIADNLLDGANQQLNSTVGMPGYLMQQDVVQAFSAAMTVRSDTFVIRTYGESINPDTGGSQGKAWAEAVVQRLPEFVDTSATTGDADPTTALSSLHSSINQAMGRRFKVIGFRWLTPNDL